MFVIYTLHRSKALLYHFHSQFLQLRMSYFLQKFSCLKNDKVKVDILPETNEEYISVTYGCIGFIDSYQFLSSSLDS